jgi:hypothetical protein
LEKKFHAHYYTGSNEKKLIDLTTLRQKNNETPMEFHGLVVLGACLPESQKSYL